MNSSTPLRFGVLGAARITTDVLIDPARSGVAVMVAAVAARDPARAAAYAHAHGIPVVHRDYAALIADEAIDAVYVPLPNSLHAEWTIRALGAGKHVLCEKPIASNAAEAEAIAVAARETGLVVAEAFHYRHHPLARRIEAIVRAGLLGDIERIEGRFDVGIPSDDPVRWSWELSGGATMDLGCYPLQMIRWLGGGEPAVLSAQAVIGPRGVDASMVATLRLPNGGGAAMRCSMVGDLERRATLLVRGSRGELEVDEPVAPQFGHRLRLTVDGVTEYETVAGDSTYVCQLRDFVSAVRSGTSMPVDADDAVANMRLIDAVYIAAGMQPRGGGALAR